MKRAALTIASLALAPLFAAASCGSSDSNAPHAAPDAAADSSSGSGWDGGAGDAGASTDSSDAAIQADSAGGDDGGDASAAGGDSSADAPSDGESDASSGADVDAGASACGPPVRNYVYVVSDANMLYLFDPTKFPSSAAFTPVGMIPCVPPGSYVSAIAIDRRALAYVNFHDGSIAGLTLTAPLQCSTTGFRASQQGFSNDLGMAFSSDVAGSDSETLYVSDQSGPGGNCVQATPGPGCMGLGLGRLDVGTWTATHVGPFTSTVAGYNAQLAGTGGASLYGFFTTQPSSLGPIDKANGHTDSPPPTVTQQINVGMGGYAFAFWGGDFYFFTAPGANTVPQRLQTSTGIVTSGDMLTFVIVAAATSTCAPTHP
jgi:hypothetical protein